MNGLSERLLCHARRFLAASKIWPDYEYENPWYEDKDSPANLAYLRLWRAFKADLDEAGLEWPFVDGCVRENLFWRTADEIEKFADYVNALDVMAIVPGTAIGTVANSNDERDEYIYGEWNRGTDHNAIIDHIKAKRGWRNVTTWQSVQQAAQRYAKRKNLEPLKARKK